MRKTRFELATFWSVARRSIQLSYLRMIRDKLKSPPAASDISEFCTTYITQDYRLCQAGPIVHSSSHLLQNTSVKAGIKPERIATFMEFEWLSDVP